MTSEYPLPLLGIQNSFESEGAGESFHGNLEESDRNPSIMGFEEPRPLMEIPPGKDHNEQINPARSSSVRVNVGAGVEMPHFQPVGLTPRGQQMLASAESKNSSVTDSPEQKTKKVWYRGKIKPHQRQDNDGMEIDESVPDFVKPNLVTTVSEENRNLPRFLLCPLCRDLLLDPVVLPCFHTVCGTKCLPKVSEDKYSVWCPECKTLQKVKFGIETLHLAETFHKMSSEVREKRESGVMDNSEYNELSLPENKHERVESKQSDVDDLTCQVCRKIFSLPLRLPCSHAICKFPCAYKTLMYNFKLVCPVCEKPAYLNGGMNSLPVAEDLVSRIKEIKGEHYLEDCENQWKQLDEDHFIRGSPSPSNTDDAPQFFNEDEINKARLKKLEKREQKNSTIPSLLSLDLPTPPALNNLPPPTAPGQPPENIEPKPIPHIPDEELLYSDSTIAEEVMGISWAGPKRCRQPQNKHNENKRNKPDFNRNRRGDRNQKGGRDQDYNHQRSNIPSLLDDNIMPPILGAAMDESNGRFQGPVGMGPPGNEPFPPPGPDMFPPGPGDQFPFDNPNNPPGVYQSPEIPGQQMLRNNPDSIIAPMLSNAGSGPPPIVNYESPAPPVTAMPEVGGMASPPGAMPNVNILPPGTQPVPTSLPVMDPSTIPTMNSAFEYQAHWTKFVQQTMAYYNSIYAAQGGTPPEAQQMINDYLSKCWAWYSAFTNLCQVNPEYKDINQQEKKQEEKAEGGNQKKKKKKNKNKGVKQATTPTVESETVDSKEVEELKIMLLKKQLELKVSL